MAGCLRVRGFALRVPVLLALPIITALVAVAGTSARSPADDDARRARELARVADRLRPLHKKLGKPKPGDWLDAHTEKGQTFQRYLRCRPVRPTKARSVIYIQPLGEFDETQRKIITQTADFMGRYFGLEVTVRPDVALSVIPAKARRRHPEWGMEQVLTSYVLDDVLKPTLPRDAAVLIALTSSDLWPGRGWNFVFGQASLRERVGVYSISRNGDPHEGEAAYRLCLLRTLKTATHETGHMFSMRHCILYQCNMCGSNHREESDHRPLCLCPECAAKVCWAARLGPVARYEKLAEFCKEAGLKDEEAFYRKSIEALKSMETSR